MSRETLTKRPTQVASDTRGLVKVRRAIISVSDKSGIVDFARELQALGVEIISTGGTMNALKKAGVQVVSISSFTGSPEILDGRVKTLHPKVHSGILFRREDPQHVQELAELEYKPIDMIVVNLYPFEETVAKPDATHEEIIENIDIGGPSMIRAGAKNFQSVAVVTSAELYPKVMAELKSHDGALSYTLREELAASAYALTGRYDQRIAEYFMQTTGRVSATEDSTTTESSLPDELNFHFRRQQSLRYGENPHQGAAFYSGGSGQKPALADAKILSGKELSYNNIADLDAALEMTLDFARPFACVLKHANPCGAAEGDTLAEAYTKALATDPLSAFGSIIGLNRTVDLKTAQTLDETQFIECILAPGYEADALELLSKKKNRRLLALPGIEEGRPVGELYGKFVRGGMLYQSSDDRAIAESDLTIATEKKPTAEQIRTLLFAWRVVKHTKSNAIVLAKDCATVGIGMGQTSRVDSAFMAVKRAGERAKGSCVASDAFFPMTDGLLVTTDAGAVAIIQPGGSKKDDEVIAAANKAGVSMVFTGIRSFKH